MIEVVGGDELTIEASTSATYQDQGAICSDLIDGVLADIDHSGEVNRQVVQEQPYMIQYSCTNSVGGTSTASRSVYVRDSKCPSCTLLGQLEMTVEASFPYDDEGIHCTDSFSTVTTQVIGSVDVEQQGTYYVTYRSRDTSGNWAHDCADSVNKVFVRTVFVVDSLKPVLSLAYRGTALKSKSVVETSSDSPFIAESSASIDISWIAAGAGLVCAALTTGFFMISASQKDDQIVPV